MLLVGNDLLQFAPSRLRMLGNKIDNNLYKINDKILNPKPSIFDWGPRKYWWAGEIRRKCFFICIFECSGPPAHQIIYIKKSMTILLTSCLVGRWAGALKNAYKKAFPSYFPGPPIFAWPWRLCDFIFVSRGWYSQILQKPWNYKWIPSGLRNITNAERKYFFVLHFGAPFHAI